MIQDLLPSFSVTEILSAICVLSPICNWFVFSEPVSVDPECEEELQKECGLP